MRLREQGRRPSSLFLEPDIILIGTVCFAIENYGEGWSCRVIVFRISVYGIYDCTYLGVSQLQYFGSQVMLIGPVNLV